MNGLDRLRGYPGRDPRLDGLREAAGELDAEFRDYAIGVCRTWDGPALEAQRRDRDAAGIRTVITADADEMRAALAGDLPPDSG